MEQITIPAILIGLLALYPGWLMCQKAYFMARWRWLVVALSILLPLVFAVPMFYLPFLLAKGKQVKDIDMFTDFVTLGICPLLLVALIAYVMDHLSERLGRSLVSGTTCIAIALLPIAYHLFGNKMFEQMGITLL